jgi:hypothetical protein
LEFIAIKREDCGQWAIPGVCKLSLTINTGFRANF